MIMRYYNKAQQLKKTNHVFRYSQGSGLAPPEIQLIIHSPFAKQKLH